MSRMNQPADETDNTDPAAGTKPTRRERIQALVARAKDQSVELLAGLERIRPESRTVRAGYLIFERDRQFPTSLLTGALAAKIVIFLIPFLILIIFMLGLAVDYAERSAAEAVEDAGLTGMFAQAVEDSEAASGQLRVVGLLFTSFAMVWAANSLGRTIRLSTSVVWRSPRRRVDRWWLVPLTVIAVALGAMLINAASQQLNVAGPIDDIIRLAIEMGLIAGIWLVVSRFLPHDPAATRWRDFVPGAIVMAIALITLRIATVVYLAPKWGTLSERYGDIGMVLVLLSFAYLVGLAVVGSAHVNSATFYTQRDPSQVAPEGRSSPCCWRYACYLL